MLGDGFCGLRSSRPENRPHAGEHAYLRIPLNTLPVHR